MKEILFRIVALLFIMAVGYLVAQFVYSLDGI